MSRRKEFVVFYILAEREKPYELLPYGQTLNSDIYCLQLDSLKQAIDQARIGH